MAAINSRRSYLVTAVIIAAMTSIYAAWRYSNGLVPAPEVFRLYEIIMTILVVTWLATDPDIPAAQRPSFDHGALIWATFPLLAAYQMYSAHRWRGIFLVLGLMTLIAAPHLSVGMIYLVG